MFYPILFVRCVSDWVSDTDRRWCARVNFV